MCVSAIDASGLADVDECAEDSDGCEQVCTNTEGSYLCSCFLGYTLDKDDDHICVGT